jgi:hypothetical protein
MQINESAFAPSAGSEWGYARIPGSHGNELAGEVSVTWHENEVPALAEAELARLYGSLFSSIPFFRVYGELENSGTYIACRNDSVSSVFLFKLQDGKIQVQNETATIDGEEIRLFAAHAFGRFKAVNEIRFRAVAVRNPERIHYPHCRFRYTDDIVLALPATEDEYVARLGKSTRKNIKHHLSRAKRSLPGFSHEVYSTEDASEEDIRTIVGFNRLRMAGKNKVSSLDDAETARMIDLVRECGLVSVIKVDGQVRAGSICYQVGKNFISSVNAHDPGYDDFRLGTLCCYLTVLESIRRQGKEFHFLWGRYEYKFSLLGVLQRLDEVSVFRSRMRLLANGGTVMRNAFRSGSEQLKLRLVEESRKNNPVVRNTVKLLRKLRGAGMGAGAGGR